MILRNQESGCKKTSDIYKQLQALGKKKAVARLQRTFFLPQIANPPFFHQTNTTTPRAWHADAWHKQGHQASPMQSETDPVAHYCSRPQDLIQQCENLLVTTILVIIPLLCRQQTVLSNDYDRTIIDNVYNFGSHRSKRLASEQYNLCIILASSFWPNPINFPEKIFRERFETEGIKTYLRNCQRLDFSGIYYIYIHCIFMVRL